MRNQLVIYTFSIYILATTLATPNRNWTDIVFDGMVYLTSVLQYTVLC